MARQHPEEPTLVELSIEEVKAMGKQGMGHPSTRPVLTGGAVGAVIGAVLPTPAGGGDHHSAGYRQQILARERFDLAPQLM